MLRFNAYFKQTVHESPNEHFRVREVSIFYYLEDDSISVVEPVADNSGIPQGKLIKRQRLPKNDLGDFWHWKDFNLGIDVIFYGKVFHIYNCDGWTTVSYKQPVYTSYIHSSPMHILFKRRCQLNDFTQTYVKKT